MSLFQLPSIVLQEHNSSSSRHLIPSLLETFIPGYGTISRLLVDILGFDITLIVSIALLAFALLRSIDFLKAQTFGLVMRYGTCSVQIDSEYSPLNSELFTEPRAQALVNASKNHY
jgi:hypothetical protein